MVSKYASIFSFDPIPKLHLCLESVAVDEFCPYRSLQLMQAINPVEICSGESGSSIFSTTFRTFLNFFLLGVLKCILQYHSLIFV